MSSKTWITCDWFDNTDCCGQMTDDAGKLWVGEGRPEDCWLIVPVPDDPSLTGRHLCPSHAAILNEG